MRHGQERGRLALIDFLRSSLTKIDPQNIKTERATAASSTAPNIIKIFSYRSQVVGLTLI